MITRTTTKTTTYVMLVLAGSIGGGGVGCLHSCYFSLLVRLTWSISAWAKSWRIRPG